MMQNFVNGLKAKDRKISNGQKYKFRTYDDDKA